MDREMEEKITRVLKGLIQCSKSPEVKENCGDCPYLDYADCDVSSCIARLCREAYTVITHLDKLTQQMTDPNTAMIDKTAKSVQALRYCQTRECYGENHECPYHNQEDCIGVMQADLVKMIDGGDA